LKKEYISREFFYKGVTLSNVLAPSVENYSEYVAPTDPNDEPIIENDDYIWD
jgi:hypothetical protein